ncbi:hypothetical protein QBC40DRAFT_28448, partial [Triangularia verruculosa]
VDARIPSSLKSPGRLSGHPGWLLLPAVAQSQREPTCTPTLRTKKSSPPPEADHLLPASNPHRTRHPGLPAPQSLTERRRGSHRQLSFWHHSPLVPDPPVWRRDCHSCPVWHLLLLVCGHSAQTGGIPDLLLLLYYPPWPHILPFLSLTWRLDLLSSLLYIPGIIFYGEGQKDILTGERLIFLLAWILWAQHTIIYWPGFNFFSLALSPPPTNHYCNYGWI